MNGNRERTIDTIEHGRRSVSLVDIKVKDSHVVDVEIVQSVYCAYGQVIEHTIARAKASVCMVGAPRHVRCKTTELNGMLGGLQGAAHEDKSALNHGFCPRG